MRPHGSPSVTSPSCDFQLRETISSHQPPPVTHATSLSPVPPQLSQDTCANVTVALDLGGPEGAAVYTPANTPAAEFLSLPSGPTEYSTLSPGSSQLHPSRVAYHCVEGATAHTLCA